jgi:peptidoglycan/xylan/chitin deacetylase (PgdA/CDA1 family)
MLRRLAKTAVASACHWTRADALLRRASGTSREPLVLAFHRVVEDIEAHPTSIPAMLIRTGTLERQLDWLGKHYRILSLDELGARIAEGGTREALAALTFDDGYDDVYENAFPLLKRKGMPATVFVVTDLIGTERLQLHDRLYLLLVRAYDGWREPRRDLQLLLEKLGLRLRGRRTLAKAGTTAFRTVRLLLGSLSHAEVQRFLAVLEAAVGPTPEEIAAFRPLSWDKLAAMQRSGLITVGSHTRTHALLPNEGPSRVRDEIAGSREVLEQRLGAPVRHFAYPAGAFDATVIDAVKGADYRFAYTTCRCRDPREPLLTVPRRGFWEGSCLDAEGRFSPAIMSCYVSGLFGMMSRCPEDHGLEASRRERVQ